MFSDAASPLLPQSIVAPLMHTPTSCVTVFVCVCLPSQIERESQGNLTSYFDFCGKAQGLGYTTRWVSVANLTIKQSICLNTEVCTGTAVLGMSFSFPMWFSHIVENIKLESGDLGQTKLLGDFF